MCGLAGFLSIGAKMNNGTYSDKRAFAKQMLYLSAMRGIDSTGIAMCATSNGQDKIYKRALSSPDFLQLNLTEKMLTDIDLATVFLAHTRSKTMGPCGDDEAHPFKYEHITMIHNGTVSNYKSIGADGCPVATDSAHIAYAMAKNGALQTLEKLVGAFSIVWYDELEETFNIARNTERPMYFIDVPEWNGLVFGSEIGMLGSVLDRNNIKTKGKFLYPEEYQILTWSTKATAKLEYTIRPFVQRRPSSSKPTTAPTTSGGSGGQTGSADSSTTKQTDGTTSTTSSRKDLPVSKKAVAKAQGKLDKYHIKYMATFGGDFEQFIQYPKNNQGAMGMIVLKMRGALNGMICHIHNIKKAVFDKLATGGTILVSVVNVKKLSGKDILLGVPYEHSQLYHYVQEERRSKKAPPVVGPEEDEPVIVPTEGLSTGGIGLFKGPRGRYFDELQWLDLTSDGCAVCSSTLQIHEAQEVLWVGPMESEPVCKECKSNPQLMEDLGLSQHMQNLSRVLQ
jgi:hypothetical protein